MPLSSGTRLGSYEILSPLGAGGMGEVYRAKDAKLGREVAIKVLPDAFAKDPERLARFDQEARLLAALNHPNIAAIYGLEEADGIRYLALELVPGDTLAERIGHAPVPVDEALTLCRQIAEALEAAHERGIIHRDLKPANVKVTPDGKVKVLDFGLAKAFETDPTSRGEDLSQSPTASFRGSGDGVILGTAAYMSPEQARGKPVDKRTDIWSFGCVLYECLTGKQAFAGETASDTIAKILEREPNWSALPGRRPPNLDTLLRRCLQKDASRRLRDIGDARIELDETISGGADVSPRAVGDIAVRTGRPSVGWIGGVGLAGALLAALVTWFLASGGPQEAKTDLAVSQVARLTHDPGLSEWPTWSPDGGLLAFASSRSGDFEIYVRRVDGGQEVNITNNPGQDFQPAFSPEGNQIAFVSTRSSRTGMIKIGANFGMEFRTFGGDLWLAPALGGRARRLARDANFPAWHPNGRRIAYVSGLESRRSILEIPADGGAPTVVLSGDKSKWEIVKLNYAPGGDWISFESVEGEIMLVPAEGGEPRELLPAPSHSHVWDSSRNRLLYLSRERLGGTRLLSVEVDEAAGALMGFPRPFSLMTGLLRDLALSRDGRQLALSELEGSLNLTLLPLSSDGGSPAGPERILNSGQVIDRYPAVSPDGRRVAFASDRLGPMETWIVDVETGRQERLQLPGQDLGSNLPQWSPDGKHLVVDRYYPDSKSSVWIAAVDGSYAEELIPLQRGFGAGTSFSPDGKSLLYSARAGKFTQLFLMELDTRETHQLTDSASNKEYATWSRNGEWIAFTSDVSGAVQVWRMPAAGGKEEQLTSGEERIRHTFYSPDDRWLYFQPSHRNIYRMPAGGGSAEAVTTFPEAVLFIEEPAISPDGRFLVYCRSNGGSSLWRLTLENN
ncbi:MAG: protein kinase [Acidobacteriota bacterium]